MHSALAIAKKELYLFFTTPIAYVAIFATAFLGAFFFLGLTSDFISEVARYQRYDFHAGKEHLNLTDWVLYPLLMQMAMVQVFTIPFLSMRLFAEERRQRTVDLLLSVPIRSSAIVAG